MNEKKTMDYSRFNDMINKDEYNRQFADIEKNGGKRTYEDIPEGTYEVKLARLELVSNKKDEPMVKIAFVILKGEFKGQWIWNNYNVIYPLATHNLNTLLKEMNPETPIVWDGDFAHYADMLADVLEELENNAGFVLTLTKDKKDFNVISIDPEESWDLSEAEKKIGMKNN